MQSLTGDEYADERLVAMWHIELGGGKSVYPVLPSERAGHGNDRVWKAWKAITPASHPSHTLWKSLRDSHIPTASATGYLSFRAHSTQTIATARGL